jgi:hypothetical protein
MTPRFNKRIELAGLLSLLLLASSWQPSQAQLSIQTFSTQPVVVQTPTGPQVQNQTVSQNLAVPYPLVPTDTTGIGGSLGHAQDIRKVLLGHDRNTVPDSHGWIVARDPRYNFTGRWQALPSLSGSRVALAPGGVAVAPTRIAVAPTGIATTRTLAAVIPSATPVVIAPSEDSRANRIDNALTRGDLDATLSTTVAQIMPTCNAKYVASCNDIALEQGALMVKATKGQPIYVSSALNGNQITVRLAAGAVALVSMLDGRFMVANLVDSAENSVVLNVGDKTRCDSGTMPVRVGYLAELYPCGSCARSEVVAYTIPNTIPMTNGLTMEVMRISYPRALKRFNITRNLTACDMRRLMKTAAAVSYIDREREWNGFALAAP